MSTIQSTTGLASGIDIGALVKAIIGVEHKPIDQLQTRLQDIQAQKTALSNIQAGLLSLTTSVVSLQSSSTFKALNVQNSSPSQFTITSQPGATPSSYALQSVRLASTNQSLSRGYATNTQTVGAGQIVISMGGDLNHPLRLELLNDGAGVQRGQIKITARNGAAADIDLRNAVTIDDVAQAINKSTIGVTASILGGRLTLTDTTGSTANNLQVAEIGGGTTAADLGILNSVSADSLTGSDILTVNGDFTLGLLDDGNGIRRSTGSSDLVLTLKDGSILAVNLDDAATLGNVVSAINSTTGNEGKLTAALVDGRLKLTDNTGGGGTLSVASASGSNAATVLGLDAAASGNELTGNRLIAGLDTVLLRNLRGGQGITARGEISLTDRTGTTATIDLSAAESLDEVLSAINSAKSVGDVKLQLTARLNDNGTGIVIDDTSGATASDLVIADVGGGTLAVDLGIAVSAAQTTVGSGNLYHRYVGESQSLANYGPKGTSVPTGSFRVTDSAGNQAVINITSSVKTIGDVIDRINAASGIQVTAKLNSTGDGFEIVDDAGGAGTPTVTEVGGKTATSLRLMSPAALGGDGKFHIDSRMSTVIDIEATDTLTQISTKLNSAGGMFRSSVVNTGSPLNPYRLSVTSATSGAAGSLKFDDGGLGLNFSTQTPGQDAVLRVGAISSPSSYLVTSNTNTFANAVSGISVSLLQTGDSVASVTTTQDTSKIQSAISNFVTLYNTYIDTAASLSKYDTVTTTRAALQGSGTLLRIQQRFSDLINRVRGAQGDPVRSLADVGVTVSKGGKLAIDSTRLSSTLQSHPEEVAALFTDADTGFGVKLLDTLTNLNDSTKGSLTVEINGLGTVADSMTSRIADLETLLGNRQNQLLRQFQRMDNAISQLQTQQDAIKAMFDAVTNSSDN